MYFDLYFVNLASNNTTDSILIISKINTNHNTDRKRDVSPHVMIPWSRSRGDFDRKENCNFSLAEVEFQHKFEKFHTGVDPKNKIWG